MLLAVDIGNSNIKLGFYNGEHLQSKISIPTKDASSPDVLRTAFGRSIDRPTSSALICSAVPEVEDRVAAFLRTVYDVEPDFVRNEWDFGLKISYEPLMSLGTDRLVNAFSAASKYGVPCIVCSFGTATTIDAVNSNREYLGGVIAPGLGTLSTALHLNAPKLPEVMMEKPSRVIQNTTGGCIRSGITYGYLAMVDGLISRIKKEMGGSPKVVATGGAAPRISETSDLVDHMDENLLLNGLRMLQPL